MRPVEDLCRRDTLGEIGCIPMVNTCAISGKERFQERIKEQMATWVQPPQSLFLPMDTGYITYPETFGNGVRIGLVRRLIWMIHVRVRRGHPAGKQKLHAAALIFAINHIAIVTELLPAAPTLQIVQPEILDFAVRLMHKQYI